MNICNYLFFSLLTSPWIKCARTLHQSISGIFNLTESSHIITTVHVPSTWNHDKHIFDPFIVLESRIQCCIVIHDLCVVLAGDFAIVDGDFTTTVVRDQLWPPPASHLCPVDCRSRRRIVESQWVPVPLCHLVQAQFKLCITLFFYRTFPLFFPPPHLACPNFCYKCLFWSHVHKRFLDKCNEWAQYTTLRFWVQLAT